MYVSDILVAATQFVYLKMNELPFAYFQKLKVTFDVFLVKSNYLYKHVTHCLLT